MAEFNPTITELLEVQKRFDSVNYDANEHPAEHAVTHVGIAVGKLSRLRERRGHRDSTRDGSLADALEVVLSEVVPDMLILGAGIVNAAITDTSELVINGVEDFKDETEVAIPQQTLTQLQIDTVFTAERGLDLDNASLEQQLMALSANNVSPAVKRHVEQSPYSFLNARDMAYQGLRVIYFGAKILAQENVGNDNRLEDLYKCRLDALRTRNGTFIETERALRDFVTFPSD